MPATDYTVTPSIVDIYIDGDQRVLNANGISNHLTGEFPNRRSPNSISPQNYEYRIPLYLPQKITGEIQNQRRHAFGLAINGISSDPGAAEWDLGIRGSQWQYEALSGAVSLGFDENHAHVQPNGSYHYHGFSNPFDESSYIELQTSSYRLKTGQRPCGDGDPGGYYDGTFVADYEYVAELGSLDECNGKTTVTPDFPDGTYACFLTEFFPVVPRCFSGSPPRDFAKRRQ